MVPQAGCFEWLLLKTLLKQILEKLCELRVRFVGGRIRDKRHRESPEQGDLKNKEAFHHNQSGDFFQMVALRSRRKSCAQTTNMPGHRSLTPCGSRASVVFNSVPITSGSRRSCELHRHSPRA